MINQCFQCYLWRESVFLLCQELCGLALVVASQDRSAVESGPRAEGAGYRGGPEGNHTTRILA